MKGCKESWNTPVKTMMKRSKRSLGLRPMDKHAQPYEWPPIIQRTSGRTVRFEGILERALNENGRIAEERIGEDSNGRTFSHSPSLYPPINGQTNHPSYAYPYAPHSNVPFSQPLTYQPTSMGRSPSFGGCSSYQPFPNHHLNAHTHNYSSFDDIPMQKLGSIVNYDDLKAKFRSHFNHHKKFTKTHLAMHNIKQKEGEDTRAIVTRYTEETLQILGLNEEQRISGFVHGLKTMSLVEFFSTDLPTTYKAHMEKTYTWIEAKEMAMNGAPVKYREGFDRLARNTSELKRQTEEAYRSGKLAHLVKGIRKGKAKASDTQQGNWKKSDKYNNVFESAILMIRGNNPKRKFVKQEVHGVGETTFPPVIDRAPSTDPVVIKILVSKRQVNMVYMDYGSSCEVIYEHCFLKLKISIRVQRVDSNILLIGFLREHSWPLGEVPLEITIGEGNRSRTKTLKFVIVMSDSPYNLLLGRTTMQKMGIVISIIHAAIKFQTSNGVGAVYSSYNAGRVKDA
ncbi:reverse transcriptase domain-containing protein [Tanacetum coccineum]